MPITLSGGGFTFNDANFSIIGERLESGQVYTTDGVSYGLTNFSEFSVGAGEATGLTYEYADEPNTTVSIGNDASEGNYIAVDLANFDDEFTVTIDSFDSVITDKQNSTFEVLSRIYLESEPRNNRSWGMPAIFVGGTSLATFDGIVGSIYTNISDVWRHRVVQIIDGYGGVLVSGNVTFTDSTPRWVWIRFRIEDNGATDNWYLKSWEGDISAEPASWDGSNLSTFKRDYTNLGTKMGFAGLSLMYQNVEFRLSYFSFSSDPDTIPPPTPN